MKLENLSDKELIAISAGDNGIINWIWGAIGNVVGYYHNNTFVYGQAMSGGTCCEDECC